MEAALLSLSARAAIRSVLPFLRLPSPSDRPELRAPPVLREQLAPQASPGPPERQERPVLLDRLVPPERRVRPVLLGLRVPPERRVRQAQPVLLEPPERRVRPVLPGQRVR